MGAPSPTIKQHILAASGNQCAFPACSTQIFDIEERCRISQICHIKGNNPGSARYDPTQSETDRQSYSNLIAMCNIHATIIDNSVNQGRYTVEYLEQLKDDHESKIAQQGDRRWISPPNATIMVNESVQTPIYWWTDKNGIKQIYTKTQLRILNDLRELLMPVMNISILLETLNDEANANNTIGVLKQQYYAKIPNNENSFASFFFTMLAKVPNITFGEFLKYAADGQDITSVIDAVL